MATSYTKTVWTTGDFITADRMNNIENTLKAVSDEISNACGQNAAEDNTLASRLNDMIMVQNTKPNSPNNEIWINTSNDLIEIPTEEEFEALRDRVDRLDSDVNALIGEVGKHDKVVSSEDDFTISNREIKINGTEASYLNWKLTGLIPCSGYESVNFNLVGFRSADVTLCTIAFYDKDENFMQEDYVAYPNSAPNGIAYEGTANIPANAAYLRALHHPSLQSNPSVTLIVNGAVSNQSEFLMEQSEFLMERNNATRNNGLKICCIGDSLTLGIDYKSHVIKENYPYFMGKYLNADILNYGKSGTNSVSWWNNHAQSFNFDNTIDVVLIMFGTNGGLGNNTLDTDVEPHDDWNEYANTKVGCYCKIIEYVMEQTQNHSQIFLLTPPYSTYSTEQENWVITSEATIRAIAKRYSLPVIDVLNECGMGKFNGDIFRPYDGCHFNAKGYHKLGTFIGSQVRAFLSWFDLSDVYNDETPVT